MEDYYTVQTPEHHNTLFQELHTLQKQGVLCDVVLAAEDGEVMAHKVILMAASKYFREKLSQTVNPNNCRIYLKGISVVELANLVKYIYTGKLLVAKETMDVTLEVSEILELNGVIRGYREITAYEEMKCGTSDLDMHASSAPISGQDVHMSSTAGTSPYTAQLSSGTQNLVPVVDSGAVSGDPQAQPHQDIQVTEYREDGSSVTYTIEQAENADANANQGTSNEYSFEFNPYEEQYMDVSVGTSVGQNNPPVPPLKKMGQPISEEQRAVDERAQHQDLLSVAIEKLTGDSTMLESQMKQQETDLAISSIVSEEVTCDSTLPESYVVGETSHGKFVNGTFDTKIVTLDAGVVSNERGGKTSVYTVALDPATIKRPLKMPRTIKKKTEKEKEAEKVAEMYRQKKREMRKSPYILPSVLKKLQIDLPSAEPHKIPEILKSPDSRITRSAKQPLFTTKSNKGGNESPKKQTTPRVHLKETRSSPKKASQVSKSPKKNDGDNVHADTAPSELGQGRSLFAAMDKEASKTDDNEKNVHQKSSVDNKNKAVVGKPPDKPIVTSDKKDPPSGKVAQKTKIVYETSEDFGQVVNFDSDEDDHPVEKVSPVANEVKNKKKDDNTKGSKHKGKKLDKTPDVTDDSKGNSSQEKKDNKTQISKQDNSKAVKVENEKLNVDPVKMSIPWVIKPKDVRSVSSESKEFQSPDNSTTTLSKKGTNNSTKNPSKLTSEKTVTVSPVDGDENSTSKKQATAKSSRTASVDTSSKSNHEQEKEAFAVPEAISSKKPAAAKSPATVKSPAAAKSSGRALVDMSSKSKQEKEPCPNLEAQAQSASVADTFAGDSVSQKLRSPLKTSADSSVTKVGKEKNVKKTESASEKTENETGSGEASKLETRSGKNAGLKKHSDAKQQETKSLNSDVTVLPTTEKDPSVVQKSGKIVPVKSLQDNKAIAGKSSNKSIAASDKHKANGKNASKNKSVSSIVEALSQANDNGHINESNEGTPVKQMVDAVENGVSNFSHSDVAAHDAARSSATKRKGKIPRRLPSTATYRFCSNGNSIPIVRSRKNSRNEGSSANGATQRSPKSSPMANSIGKDDSGSGNKSSHADEEENEDVPVTERLSSLKSPASLPVGNIKTSKQEVHVSETGSKIVVGKHMLPEVRLKKFTEEDILAFAKNISHTQKVDDEEEETDTEFEDLFGETMDETETTESGNGTVSGGTDALELNVPVPNVDSKVGNAKRAIKRKADPASTESGNGTVSGGTDALELDVPVPNVNSKVGTAKKGIKRKADPASPLSDGRPSGKKSKVSGFQCGCCNKSFKTLNLVSRHMKTCSKREEFELQYSADVEENPVPVAPSKVKRKDTKHVEQDRESSVKKQPKMKYICPEDNCQYLSDKVVSISRHLVMFHHKQGTNLFSDKSLRRVPAAADVPSAGDGHEDKKASTLLQCSCCGTIFMSQSALELHIWKRARSGKDCEFCGEKFMSGVACLNHKIQEHDITIPHSVRRFECSLCDFIGFSYKQIDAHYQEHNDEHIPCRECTEAFTTIGELTKHMVIHNKKGKLFKCKECDFATTTKLSLTSHLKLKHNIVKQKLKNVPGLVGCRFCQYKTVLPGNYRKHMLRAHDIVVVPKQSKSLHGNHPPGTLLTRDGDVFDPDNDPLPKMSVRRQEAHEPDNDAEPGKRKHVSLFKLPLEQFTVEVLKRHEAYCKQPDKPKKFMSKNLAIATAHPSFPQASPNVRGTKANKLYNTERMVTRFEDITSYVTGVGTSSPEKTGVPVVANEVEVDAGVVGTSDVVSMEEQQGADAGHMVVVDGAGRRKVVKSTDFYQSVANRSIEVITTLLEAGQQIDKEVEIQNE